MLLKSKKEAKMENYTGVIIMSILALFGIFLSIGKYFYERDEKNG